MPRSVLQYFSQATQALRWRSEEPRFVVETPSLASFYDIQAPTSTTTIPATDDGARSPLWLLITVLGCIFALWLLYCCCCCALFVWRDRNTTYSGQNSYWTRFNPFWQPPVHRPSRRAVMAAASATTDSRRRSTRLASRAPSEATSNAPNTPAARKAGQAGLINTSSRRANVPTRESNAYGGRSLNTATRPTQLHTSVVGNPFGETRDQSVAHDDDHDFAREDLPSRRSSRQPANVSSARSSPSVFGVSHRDVSEDVSLTRTSHGIGKTYGDLRETGAFNEADRQLFRRSPEGSASRTRLMASTVRRSAGDISKLGGWVFVGLVLLLLGAANLAAPAGWQSSWQSPLQPVKALGSSLGRSLNSGVASSLEFVRPQIVVRSDSLNDDIFSRLRELEEATGSIRIDHGHFKARFSEEIADLQGMLPAYIALEVDEKSGAPTIPERAWTAIQARFHQDQSDVPWTSFYDKNVAKLEDLVNQQLGQKLDKKKTREVIDRSVYHALEGQGVVRREEFLRLLEDHFREHDRELRRSLESIYSEARSTVAAAAKSFLDSLPRTDFERFLVTRALVSAEAARGRVNFFSSALGAMVNPRFTSKTWRKGRTPWSAYRLNVLWRWASPKIRDLAPLKALTPWAEAGHSWCGVSEDKTEKLSLGIVSSEPVLPKAITIEHATRDSTPDITSAPKWLDLWAEVKNEKLRVAIDRWRPAPHVKADCKSKAPGASFVCLGSSYYDIYSPSHVQSSDLSVNAEDYLVGAGIMKRKDFAGFTNFVVKVTSNWGRRDHTCLYRVRLHGEPAGGRPKPNKPSEL